MDELQPIVDMLDKYNYTVKAYITDYGCETVYPERKEIPRNQMYRKQYNFLYDPETKKHLVTITTTPKSLGALEDVIEVPIYAHKAFYLFHTQMLCVYMNYNLRLIQFFDTDKKKIDELTFMNLINCNRRFPNGPDEEYLQLEESFLDLCIGSQKDSVDMSNKKFEEIAQQYNVLAGYKVIQRISNLFSKTTADK